MFLRDVTLEDLPIFFEHQRDRDAAHMAAFVPREWDAFLLHWHKNVLGSTGVKRQTIVTGNDVAGHVVSFELDGQRVVGYWVAQAHWGRGLATAALATFLEHHERARPIFAHVAEGNIGSIRVLEKCGFTRLERLPPGSDGVVELLMRLGEES